MRGIIQALAVAAMVVTSAPAPALATAWAGPQRLAELPLVEAPAAGRGDTLAVLYSGDGGWAPIDKGVARSLASAGVPVVGVNSLRYFWNRRSPEEAATDLEIVLRHYMAVWGKSRIVLAGYSFGAGALPSIVQKLPPDLRSRIRLLALVGVGDTGELKFHVSEWLTHKPADGYPIAPTLASLEGVPMTCIYGSQDKEGEACVAFPEGLVRRIELPGNHHFNGDYAAVAGAIEQAGGL